jgi:hypothetical protein
VGDNGGADLSGGGLRGIQRRLAAFDGVIAVTSPSGDRRSSPWSYRAGRDRRGSHAPARRLIRLLTAYQLDVIEPVDTGPALLRALLTQRPDIAVVDVRLPPTFTDEGLKVAIEARAQIPGLPVLILSPARRAALRPRTDLRWPRWGRLPAQGPRCRCRPVRRRGPHRRRRWHRSRPHRGVPTASPLHPSRTAVPAHRPRTRRARPDGRGTHQRGHRHPPDRHRKGGEQTHQQHLHQTRPTPRQDTTAASSPS